MDYKTDFDRIRLVRERSLTLERNKLDSPEAAKGYFRKIYNEHEEGIEVYETMYALFCSNKLEVLGWAKVSQGGIDGTVCDVRIIAKYAIDLLATRVFLCHNHPSGTLRPSKADISLTNKLKDVLTMLDIDLLDHFIITKNNFATI